MAIDAQMLLDAEARKLVQKLDRRGQRVPSQPVTQIAVQDNGTVMSNRHRILNIKGKHTAIIEDLPNRRANIVIPGGYLFCVIDGGGQAIAPSSRPQASLAIHDNLQVVRWTLIADIVGSITIDLKRGNYDTYPTTATIIAGATGGPSLSGVQKNRTIADIVGWTQLLEDDILDIVVTSSTTVTRVTLKLQVQAVS